MVHPSYDEFRKGEWNGMHRNVLRLLCAVFMGLVLNLAAGCASPPRAQTAPPLAQAQTASPLDPDQDRTHNLTADSVKDEASVNPSTKPLENTPLKQEPIKEKAASQQQAHTKPESLPVIYYHAIKVLPKNELGMPPAEFEKQMAYLAKEGYHSISPQQLYDYYYRNGSLPSRPILITFDDGYMDNYTTALPILQKYGFKATLFLIVKKVGDRDCLTWKEVKELDQAGWDIQSHTLTHPDLTTLDAKTLKHELAASKATLEKELGKPILFFAYPSGKYNDTVVQAVKNAGYLMAFSTQKGWTDEKMNPLLVHRVYCYASMGLRDFSQRISNPNY